ncbi:MAG: lysine--tRNA ligase [Nitrospirae bacterium]|nr:lysine--tRNA ligase [Nitrospirota bacterium]
MEETNELHYDSSNELIEQRKRKLRELRDLGAAPYDDNFVAGNYAGELVSAYGDFEESRLTASPVECSVAGRLVAFRGFGKAAFAHVQDSSDKRIQIYFSKEILGAHYLLTKKLDVGDIIGVWGKLFKTRTGELTIEVTGFKVLSKSLRPLPEKWHGLKDVEVRYRQRYVDLIVNPEVRKTFALRSRITKAIRDFLENRGYIEVETPMMHPIPGGAAAKPFKTFHNALNLELFLRIAPELYLKRLLVGGYDRVFEINRNFRNEGISTKHNPEFTMLEFYTAYRDYNFLMDFTEELICYVANQSIGTLKFEYGGQAIDLTPPWKRITFFGALKEAGVPDDIVGDGAKLVKWAQDNKIDVTQSATYSKVLDEIFKEKIEPGFIQPTFVVDYPVELSPLAKRKKATGAGAGAGANSDVNAPELVDRFELFITSREIANAFSELNDPIDQKERFLAQLQDKERGDEEAHAMDEDFVRALEYGMPPAAGEGIGIDRLVMLLTNSQSIRDVILFPQLKPEQQKPEQLKQEQQKPELQKPQSQQKQQKPESQKPELH